MRIGVVGSGITGLAAAHSLQASGYQVTVFESHKELGGLAGAVRVGGALIERYYHHVFMSDRALLELLDELDLSRFVVWHESQIGYYHGNRIYRFSSPRDLVSFRPLSLAGKIKFALSTLYFQMKRSRHGLDTISVAHWFDRFGAGEVYEQVWKPLLKEKFGDQYEAVPVAWLWGRIHPRSRSRDRFFGNERLGYMIGSFDRLFQALSRRLLEAGGTVYKDCSVEGIEPLRDNSLLLRTPAGDFRFHKVVVTVPVPVFLRMVSALPEAYVTPLRRIHYRAVVCMILALDSPVTDNIYWLNVNSPNVPFGGLIEHTNLVPPAHYGGRHIVYVFNYLSPDDPTFCATEKQVRETYVEGLENMFTHFDGSRVQSSVLSRSAFATPIYGLDYLSRLPDHRTPVPNLYLANTAQVYPEDRNVSNCIANARSVCRLIKSGNTRTDARFA